MDVGNENIQRKNNKNILLYELKHYRNKYKILQNKRKYELIKIRYELSHIKELNKLFEIRIYGEKYSHIQAGLASDPLLMVQRQLGKLELATTTTRV